MHEFSPSKWERWYEIRGNKQNSHRHKLPIMISSHTCAHRRNSVVHQTLQHSHISQSAKNALRKSFPLFYIFMAYSWFLFHYISLLRRCNAMLVTVMVCVIHFVPFRFEVPFSSSRPLSHSSATYHHMSFRFDFDQRNKLMVCKREHATHIRCYRTAYAAAEVGRKEEKVAWNKNHSNCFILALSLSLWLCFLMSLLRNEIYWNVIFSTHH